MMSMKGNKHDCQITAEGTSFTANALYTCEIKKIDKNGIEKHECTISKTEIGMRQGVVGTIFGGKSIPKLDNVIKIETGGGSNPCDGITSIVRKKLD
jgi:hypothetical protein